MKLFTIPLVTHFRYSTIPLFGKNTENNMHRICNRNEPPPLRAVERIISLFESNHESHSKSNIVEFNLESTNLMPTFTKIK